jgi:hypothetical protein
MLNPDTLSHVGRKARRRGVVLGNSGTDEGGSIDGVGGRCDKWCKTPLLLEATDGAGSRGNCDNVTHRRYQKSLFF